MGVDEVSLDELNRSRLKAGPVSLADALPRSRGSVGGVTILPLVM